MAAGLGRYFLVSVDRRIPQAPQAYVFVLGPEGVLERRVPLGDSRFFWPGSPAFDGEKLWIPVTEGFEGSRTKVFVLRPGDPRARPAFSTTETLTCLSKDPGGRSLLALDWGSRHLLSFSGRGRVLERQSLGNRLLEATSFLALDDGELFTLGRRPSWTPKGSRSVHGFEEAWGMSLASRIGRLRFLVPLETKGLEGRPLAEGAVAIVQDSFGVRLATVAKGDSPSLEVFRLEVPEGSERP